MIRIVIAEDHAMVGRALTALVATEHDLHVVAVMFDGSEAFISLAQPRPDVLITDVEMPHLDGLNWQLRRNAILQEPGC